MILSSPLSGAHGHRSINHDNGQTELRALKKHGSDEARTTQLTLIQYFLKCLRWNGKKPRFQEITRLPLIPIEAEIDALIAGSGWKTSAFLQLLKETAMRPGEAVNLTWGDLDLISKTVRVTPEKGSNPRIFAVSDKLLNMLLSIKERNQV